ncbi:MAG: AtpZ/AtpI family protein [Lachnospiraceae bacterium]|jgi:ATP synthase protein I|nr:AtpZ/AtpI family protein [Lachnospiraceae bacterium]MCX4315272.1 AtpZ/AtpI family protein [Lachnospiraceae bacterium]
MKKENRNIARALFLITQLGINMLVTIFLSAWFGSFLDRKLGTSFFLIVFLILGILAAYRNAYKMTKIFYAKDKRREEREQEYFDSLVKGQKRK